MSKKKKAQQNYYLSNQIKQLKCNLRDNAIDVRPEWELIMEFNRQTFDRVPNLTPAFIGTERECGEIFTFESTWDKTKTKKPKTLTPFNGATFNENIFNDEVMIELIEQNKADIFTTDVIAAAIMASTKSNYSFDVEIKRFGDKIFIDKRSDGNEESEEGDKAPVADNILDFDTVGETSLDHQPKDDDTINGITPLMKEAKQVNNSFLYYARDEKNILARKQLDEPDPFIEDDNQIATRVGYHYNIWKIQEEDPEQGTKELRICIRCAVHSHTNQVNENGDLATMNMYTLLENNPDISNWRENLEKDLI